MIDSDKEEDEDERFNLSRGSKRSKSSHGRRHT